MRRWWRVAAGVVLLALAALAAVQPPFVQRAEHWVHYRLTGAVPAPLVVGRNGRLFLGNHEGSPAGSLIAAVCGDAVGDGAVDAAAGLVRRVVEAGRATGLPFRFVIVPTAPRLYPEDVPADIPCSRFAADRLVRAVAAADLVYPLAEMTAMRRRFDPLPRHHFHWAGEGPLRVAELVAEGMGLPRELALALRPDNRASDLNGFDPGLGLHDRIGTPDLRRAGVAQCAAARCDPAAPDAVVVFSHPGAGRMLLIADSFGDEIGGDFAEFAGQVWLVRMNLALVTAEPPLAAAIAGFHPDALVVLYHDAGALALDGASQASLALAARLAGDAGLPPARNDP